MRYLPIIIFCVLFQTVTFGQRGQGRENIEAARIGLITKRLELSADQSAKFWPIYNEYDEKKTALRKALRQLKTSYAPAAATNDEIRNDLDEMLNLRQKEVDLEKDYVKRLMKVITPRQVAELYKAEQEFNRMLLDRLEERRANRQARKP